MSSARAPTSCSAVRTLRLIIALLLLFASFTVSAEDASVSLYAAGPDTVQARARQTTTFMLFVENRTENPLNLSLDTLLPDGWKDLTADGPFRVEPGTTENRLVAVLISSRARAGAYPVTFRVRAPDDPSVEAKHGLQVVVLPEPSIAVRLLESPHYVASGDRYRTVFSVANHGNADLIVTLRVESRPDYPFELHGVENPDHVALPVGGQRAIMVEVKTPSGLRVATHARLTLTALLQEAPEAEPAVASSRVEIVPVSMGSAQIMRTVGGYTETTAAASLGTAPDGFLQSSLNLRGTIDEDGRQSIGVEIRKRLGSGDDSFNNPIDRYSLMYRNRSAELLLGDQSYSLSPLLAMNEFGRGAQAAVSLGSFGLKGLYFENAGTPSDQPNLGAAVDFSLHGAGDGDELLYSAGLSVLSFLEGRTAFGLWQRFNPLDLLSLQVDAALQSDPAGGLHPALYAEAEGGRGNVFYLTRFLRAWTGFDANYTDTQSLMLSSGLRLLERKLSLDGTYLISDGNLELDPLLPNADRDRRLRLGAGWEAAPWGSEFSLAWENNRRLDRLVPAGYDSLQNRIRFGWKQTLDDALGLRLSSSLGQTQYTLTGNEALSQNHRITLDYRPSDSLRADASLAFSGERANTESAWYTLGWDAGVYRSWKSTRLDARIYNQYYFDGSGFSGLRGGIDSRVTHSFRWGHLLTSSGNAGLSYGRQGSAVPDLRLVVSYGAPLSIPVGRRADIAVVRGRVYREETGEPIKGLVLRLNGLAVVTDSKGEYEFHLPQAGRLYLQMDRGRMAADLIPNRSVPIEVDVIDQDVRVDIGIVRAAGVRGTVELYGFPERVSSFTVAQGLSPTAGSDGRNEEPRHVRLGGLGNVLIELFDGRERIRRLTGPDGGFSFTELRPGRYTLTVAEGFIPTYHRVDRPVWEFDITPGRMETVEIRVIQDQRRIRLVQSGLSVALEGPATPHGEWTVTLERPSETVASAADQQSAPAGAALSEEQEIAASRIPASSLTGTVLPGPGQETAIAQPESPSPSPPSTSSQEIPKLEPVESEQPLPEPSTNLPSEGADEIPSPEPLMPPEATAAAESASMSNNAASVPELQGPPVPIAQEKARSPADSPSPEISIPDRPDAESSVEAGATDPVSDSLIVNKVNLEPPAETLPPAAGQVPAPRLPPPAEQPSLAPRPGAASASATSAVPVPASSPALPAAAVPTAPPLAVPAPTPPPAPATVPGASPPVVQTQPVPTPAPAAAAQASPISPSLSVPVPTPTPDPAPFIPAPRPTPTPKPFVLPRPQPTPNPFIIVPAPQATPAPSSQ